MADRTAQLDRPHANRNPLRQRRTARLPCGSTTCVGVDRTGSELSRRCHTHVSRCTGLVNFLASLPNVAPFIASTQTDDAHSVSLSV